MLLQMLTAFKSRRLLLNNSTDTRRREIMIGTKAARATSILFTRLFSFLGIGPRPCLGRAISFLLFSLNILYMSCKKKLPLWKLWTREKFIHGLCRTVHSKDDQRHTNRKHWDCVSAKGISLTTPVKRLSWRLIRVDPIYLRSLSKPDHRLNRNLSLLFDIGRCFFRQCPYFLAQEGPVGSGQ